MHDLPPLLGQHNRPQPRGGGLFCAASHFIMKVVRVDMRKILVATIVVIALGDAAYVIRVARAYPPAQSAPKGNDKSPFIRFVKNPEMAPPLQDRDISGAVVS